MALAAGHRDGGVIAHHLGADHGQRLALGRIDLARHDRGARLVFRQGQLAETGTRTRAEQADIIGDLEQRDGDGIERAMRLDQTILGRQRLEFVRSGDEGDFGQRGGFLGEGFGETDLGVQPGADGGTALGQLAQGRQGRFNAADRIGDHRGIAGKLLAQRQGRRVLQMGAADLDDGFEGLRLVVERIVQGLQRRDQPEGDLFGRSDMHRGRESVVRRLRAIDVVIGMDGVFRADFAAENLDGAIGDDFIGIHVGLRARAGLPDREGEVVVELAFGDFQRCLGDGVGQSWLEIVQPLIGARGAVFDDPQGADQRFRHGLGADREIDQRACGLRAPELLTGNLEWAKAVGFGAGLAHEGKLLAARRAPDEDGEEQVGRVSLTDDGSR